MPADYRVLERSILEAHLDHLAARLVHRLLYRYGYLARFTLTHTDAAIAIPDNCQGGEAQNASSFDHLGDAIDGHHFFLEPISTIVSWSHLALHPPLHFSHYRSSLRI